MPIQIDNSGTTGTFTLKSPAANTPFTLSLPASVNATTSLRTDGAGNLSFTPTGLVGWTPSSSTAAPNNTVNAAIFTASGGTASQGVALTGLGTSNQLLAVVPDGTVDGGNARGGSYIVELSYLSVQGGFSFGVSPKRTAATDVINANRFICIGGWMKSDTNSTNSAGIGGPNVVFNNAPNSVYIGSGDLQNFGSSLTSNVPAGGTGNNVSLHGSDAGTFPPQGMWSKQNQVVCPSPNLYNIPQSFQYGSAYGPQQGYFVVSAQTTDATVTTMTPYTGAETINNAIGLNDNTMCNFRAIVTAMVKASGGNARMWSVTASIFRGAGAATTTLVGSTVTPLFNDAGAATWNVGLTVNTTLGSIQIAVTGQASTNIQWVASCKLLGTQFS